MVKCPCSMTVGALHATDCSLRSTCQIILKTTTTRQWGNSIPVKSCLWWACLLFYYGIRLTLGRSVQGCCWAPICRNDSALTKQQNDNEGLFTVALLLATNTSTPTEEDGTLVLKNEVATGLVLRMNDIGDGCCFAFIEYLKYSAQCMLIVSWQCIRKIVTYLPSLTKSPCVGIGALIARYCSPCSNLACIQQWRQHQVHWDRNIPGWSLVRSRAVQPTSKGR